MIDSHTQRFTNEKNSPTKLIANLALARRCGGGSPGALPPVSLRGGGNWPAHGRARRSAACILPRRRPGLPRRQRLASRPRAHPRTCRYLAAVARRPRTLGLAGHPLAAAWARAAARRPAPARRLSSPAGGGGSPAPRARPRRPWRDGREGRS